MAQAASVLLVAAILLAGYLCALCTAPPHPSFEQKNRHTTDRISLVTGSFATVVRRAIVTVIAYHALLILLPWYAPSRMPQLCPQSHNCNIALFEWSTTSATALMMIYVGAAVRLSAYGGLGRSFTFHLAAPDQLVTTGIYRWIQHPSYTGLVLIGLGSIGLFLRADGAPACWMSDSMVSLIHGWGSSVAAAIVGLGVLLLTTRVKDEEEMLKQKFGAQWDEWHRRTKRFIPGAF